MWLLIFSVILILIVIYDAVYGFLPSDIQRIKWIRTVAVVSAIIILIRGIGQIIKGYRSYRFAYISAKDGSILENKNFPWTISKSTTREGETVYIINERYGDSSEILIVPDEPNDKYSIYNAIDGVGIKFSCPEEEIPNFKIKIK